MRKIQSLTLIGALALLEVPLPVSADCGDGFLEPPAEACDDGNAVGGDGCSATCGPESGYSCRAQPRVEIANASFELDPFPTGGTTGGGWTRLSREDVDWTDDRLLVGGAPCWPAGDGHQSIDMNGSDRQGTLYQTLTTLPGQHYVLTFLGSANPADGGAGTCDSGAMKDLTINVADGTDHTRTDPRQARVLTLTRRAAMRDDWRLYTYEFDALSTATTLVFIGSSPSFNGPMIDRLAIPESVCTLDSCGDGTRAATETCDDGNQDAGDGCSSSCMIEPGYLCATEGMLCAAEACGDGVVAGAEECDDRGGLAGDGCSPTCTVEPGWACVYDGIGVTSRCSMTCGTGTLGMPDPGEVCDDLDADDTNGCTTDCLLSPGRLCVAHFQCAFGVCSPDLMGPESHCAGCYDTDPSPGGLDFNCSTTPPVPMPVCDVTGGLVPACVQCLVDADCTATEMCWVGPRICVPRDDAGLSDAGGSDASIGTDAGRDVGFDGGVVDAGSVPLPDVGAVSGLDAGLEPDGGPRTGGASGGACICSLHGRSSGAEWRPLLALSALALLRRRRGCRGR